MKKVIVTGADGFLGFNLVKELIARRIEVWAIVHPESPTRERVRNFPEIHYIECQLEELDAKIAEFPVEPEVFYHLAWQGVNVLDRDNLEMQLKNIDLCMACLKFAVKLKACRFILPGSTSEYLYYGKPINELAIPTPQNPYGSVKVALRYLAQEYARQQKLDLIYVVITGIYAPDRRDNNVIFYVIDKLLRGEKPSVTKLEQLWDYVSIRDVVDALILIGKKGKRNAFYAIGHGDNQPLYKYIEVIHNYIDKTIPIGIGEVPYASEEMPSSCVDLTALICDTGFVPNIDFDDGIKEVIDAVKKEYR